MSEVPRAAIFDEAADALVISRVQDVVTDLLPERVRPRDLAEAYQVQDRVMDRLVARTGAPAGHKIGGTTPVMQAYLGIDTPCAGRLLRAEHGRGEFRTRPATVLGVECEIAVRLVADLPPRTRPYSRAEVRAAVGPSLAAIEVVEDRYRDWRAVDTPTLIADNFFHFGAVLGAESHDFDPEDLGSVVASMSIDGVTVGSGTGSDVLGHPLEGLRWLADNASQRGVGLWSGEVILLGSLVETHWVRAGSVVRIENSRLGVVEAVFLAPEGG